MLKTIAEVSDLILAGRRLLLAGDEKNLQSLPIGNWVGGTIPYFMTEAGGRTTREGIWVTELPPEVESVEILSYDADTLRTISEKAPENGFTFLILPCNSQVHLRYAQEAPDYPRMYQRPILGWVSGVHLDDVGKVSPKAMDGHTGELFADRAVAMHCTLVAGRTARVGIINLFRQGEGDVITFPTDGFRATDCWINGEPRPFAAYVREKGIDTRLPLVANYSGAMINVSFQAVEHAAVEFFAPVFHGVEYKVAAPLHDYAAKFRQAIPDGLAPAFSCNCILNYLHSDLEGKVIPGMQGPATFGEIAYQLLNQTLVYLSIE